MADPPPPPPPPPASIPSEPTSAAPNPHPASASAASKTGASLTSLPSAFLPAVRPYISETNRTVSRINKLLSTVSGLDVSLSFISYTSLFVTSAPITLPLSRALSDKSAPRSPRLRNLYALLSDVRVFLRTADLLKYYASLLALHASPPKDTFLRWNAYIQILSIAAYQALETMAYLASKAILFRRISKKRLAWMEIVSCQFWTVWVLGDLVRLGRERQLRARGREEGSGEVERRWRNSVVVNGAFLPLCLHWSVDGGLGIPEWAVGALGMIAGTVGLREAWRGTA